MIDHAEDHIPALKTLAIQFPELNAQELAKRYAETDQKTSDVRASIAHPSDCACEGNGVVYVDDDDPSKGVTKCPGP